MRGVATIGGGMQRHDAIIIGAGHNGLVAACYLARAGLNMLVLERQAYIGGAAVSRRLYEDFTYSNCSYVCSLLRPQIIRSLELPRFGLQVIPYEGGCTMMRDGGHFSLYDNHDALRREISRHSRRDAEAYDRYARDVQRQCKFIKPLLLREPPDPTSFKPRDLRELLYLARRFHGLGEERMYDTLRCWTTTWATSMRPSARGASRAAAWARSARHWARHWRPQAVRSASTRRSSRSWWKGGARGGCCSPAVSDCTPSWSFPTWMCDAPS